MSTPCPTCTWPNRETVDMVCQTCGTDYAQAAEKVALTAAEREALCDAAADDRSRQEGYLVTGPGGTNGNTPTLDEAVERIVADRVAEAVERERAAWVAKVDRLIDLLCDCGDFDGHPGDCAAYSAITILATGDDQPPTAASIAAGLRAEQDAEAAERLAKGLRGERGC